MLKKITLLILLLGFSSGVIIAQPGNIKLLDGYKHIRGKSKDSILGEISKPDGLTIKYDIGVSVGDFTKDCQEKGKRAEQCLWFKSQRIKGKDVFIAMKKDGKLIVHFPNDKANFFAFPKSNEEIADFFLMVLTY